jgi:hypothetical protein
MGRLAGLKMSLANNIDQILKTNTLSGTNFPDGVRVGTFDMPNINAVGIPTGLVYPSKIEMSASYPVATIATLSVSQPTQLPLGPSVGANSKIIRMADTGEFGVQLDSPRGLCFASSDATLQGTIYISGYDRYWKKIAFTKEIGAIPTFDIPCGIFVVTNISFTPVSVAPSSSLTIFTSAFAELPLTDYGWQSNTIFMGYTLDGTAKAPPFTAEYGNSSTTFYYYQNNIVYIAAAWDTPVSASSPPRPLVAFSPVSNSSQTSVAVKSRVLQVCYGFNSTVGSLNRFSTTCNYSSDGKVVYGATQEAVYGRANNTIGWKGWVG